jgi:hypothetical protein
MQEKPVFYYALRVDVHVAAERRSQRGIVLARPDVVAAILFKKGKTLEDSTVVLARNFQASVSNAVGYVYQLPGGIYLPPPAPDLVVKECIEKIGLTIDPARVRFQGTRQLLATMSSHAALLFGVEMTDAELKWLRDKKERGDNFSTGQNGEQIFVELCRVGDILKRGLVDWSTLGQVLAVVR